ncbi:hypothetical protein ACFQGT_10490 [Natrialbaceae archaeon GCM10025810]|uniref:DUF7344 domain-containing protein n=1 Tax=Halovalidus salilacus TaxID=3075124 RepID=UPI00360908F3
MVGTTTEFNTLLELCHEQHRRIVLAVLASEERSLTVNDLTKAIIKHNHHTSPMEVSKEESRTIRISLQHVHIPKLEDLSLVNYDTERQLVEPTSQFDQLEPQLSAIIDADPGLEPPVALWDRSA